MGQREDPDILGSRIKEGVVGPAGDRSGVDNGFQLYFNCKKQVSQILRFVECFIHKCLLYYFLYFSACLKYFVIKIF